MKRLYKAILLASLVSATACKKSFLDESPVASLSTTNAFTTSTDFTASVNGLLNLVRSHYYTTNDYIPFYYLYRTDGYYDITASAPNLPGEITPTGVATFAWTPNYKIVAEANTIISRLPASSVPAADRKVFEAKARFFRAFGYRALAYIYGGVPLILEEATVPKTDFVRASRHEVYLQAIEDLKFAAANLPSIDKVADGEISNVAANHLLAELYLADGQFQNAVNAATVVINDPNMGLMTNRFGSRSTMTPGDVYWDLFQPRNQNRKNGSGNREAIWVAQIETDLPGGAGSTTAGSQSGVYALERVHAPLVRDLKINGVAAFSWPVGDYTGGRGVGFLTPSSYYINDIWQSDFNNDIRNANNNLVRDFVGTNPASPYFGKVISTRNPPAGAVGINGAIVANKADRAFYPYQSKATQVYAHPTALYTNPSSTDPVLKYTLNSGAGGTYIDQYIFRLADTYLLRAEGYLGLSDKSSAAADINVVRARSKANPVAPANVDIDYILDERMREFGVEEKRLLTLMRLGKYVDRLKKNPYFTSQALDKYNLWPIPSSEIERNRTGKLTQNPGY